MFGLPAYLLSTVLVASFSDDFESGTLLETAAPPGQWSDITFSGNGVTTDAAAAHRGSYGLRVVDGQLGATPGVEGFVGKALPPPTTGSFYFRAWVRISPTLAPGGQFTEFATIMGNSGPNQMCTVGLLYPGSTLRMKSTGSNGSLAGNGAVVDSNWHLLEVAATNSGTTLGACALWWDGAYQMNTTTRNWSTVEWQVNRFSVGEPYSSPTRNWQGTLDFDDVRLQRTPPVSRIRVTAPTSVAQYSCAAVTVSLRDSSAQGLSGAPYTFAAALSASGAGGFFYSDAGCSAPSSGVSFAEGENSKTVYFMPTAEGATSLLARYVDFLDGTATLTVTPGSMPPDAGSGVDAGAPDAGSNPGEADAGPGSGTDAGTVDAGAETGTDAGAVDAGAEIGIDAGAVDAGTEASAPDGGGTTSDAGTTGDGSALLSLKVEIPDVAGEMSPGSLVRLRFHVHDGRTARAEPLSLALEADGLLLGTTLVSSAGSSVGTSVFVLPSMPVTSPVSFSLDARALSSGRAQVRAWLETPSGERLTSEAEHELDVGRALLDSGCSCGALSVGAGGPIALLALVLAGKRRGAAGRRERR